MLGTSLPILKAQRPLTPTLANLTEENFSYKKIIVAASAILLATGLVIAGCVFLKINFTATVVASIITPGLTIAGCFFYLRNTEKPAPIPAPTPAPKVSVPIPNDQELLGINTPSDLRTLELMISDTDGTPGVNLRGTDLQDRDFVLRRIHFVQQHVAPYAHTRQSYREYREIISEFTGWSRLLTTETTSINAEHASNSQLFRHRYTQQPNVAVIGGGPVGLLAALVFYELGFRVTVYEQFSETSGSSTQKGFAERRQPFSLVRQSRWILEKYITDTTLLSLFGLSLDNHHGLKRNNDGESGQRFALLNRSLLSDARTARIGPHASSYIPNAASFPIGKLQIALLDKIKSINDPDISVCFNMKCTSATTNERQRYTLTFNEQGDTQISPDIVYNASGGKINTILGFSQTHIAEMHGVGAFFDAPQQPAASGPPKQLSRAVRPFCSFNPEDPIYCNMEVSPEEFDNDLLIRSKLGQVASDLVLSPAREFFKVRIDLSHSNEIVRQSLDETPQLIINGGDAILRPHFITASGANFGLIGLIALHKYLTHFQGTPNEGPFSFFCTHYTKAAKLMQRQSAQMVLNLFGRPLV